ncbi:MAG TPA: hypothetical protein DEO99_01435, partial [Bacteroidetes bacterium]|nr:hypothetical protein [Bacteroidota bacterium]
AGLGIVNPTTGLFSPANAGIGSYWIDYISPLGCFYSMNIQVDGPAPQPSILNFDAFYCFKDTTYVLSALPIGGVWGNAIADSLFNPTQFTPGLSTVSYTVGSGDCASTANLSTEVGLPLNAQILNADTAICNGDEFRVEAELTGGDVLNYSYSWSPDQGNVIAFIASPNQTLTYTFVASDGCSDPDTADLIVFVKPSPTLSFSTSDSSCLGEPGFVYVDVEPPANYIYSWDNSPFVSLDTFVGQAGDFVDVYVENPLTNCFANGGGSIPAYPRVIADFTSIPNDECLDLINNSLSLLDQSSEGYQGSWGIGNVDSFAYEAGSPVEYSFEDTGTFPVHLYLTDIHGCSDSTTQTFCVEIASQIDAPTAFSPNFDGVNDVFLMKTRGISEEKLVIFDRWGNLVFQSSSGNDLSWNGFYMSQIAPMGNYVWKLSFYNEASKTQEIMMGSVTLVQ